MQSVNAVCVYIAPNTLFFAFWESVFSVYDMYIDISAHTHIYTPSPCATLNSALIHTHMHTVAHSTISVGSVLCSIALPYVYTIHSRFTGAHRHGTIHTYSRYTHTPTSIFRIYEVHMSSSCKHWYLAKPNAEPERRAYIYEIGIILVQSPEYNRARCMCIWRERVVE